MLLISMEAVSFLPFSPSSSLTFIIALVLFNEWHFNLFMYFYINYPTCAGQDVSLWWHRLM